MVYWMHTPRLNVQDHRRTLVPNCGTSLFPGHAYKGKIPQTHTELICWCRKCCPVVSSDLSHFRHLRHLDGSYWLSTWCVLHQALWNFLRLTTLIQNITGYVVSMTLLWVKLFSVSTTGRHITATVWNSWRAWNKMTTAMQGPDLNIYICTPMDACCLRRPERRVRSLGTGFTDGYEPHGT